MGTVKCVFLKGRGCLVRCSGWRAEEAMKAHNKQGSLSVRCALRSTSLNSDDNKHRSSWDEVLVTATNDSES